MEPVAFVPAHRGQARTDALCHATFRVERTGSAVRVTVIDDGIGIPTDKLDRIFEPFQRAGQEAGPIEGTGIGLTISKRLAELMRGAVGSSDAGFFRYLTKPVKVAELTATVEELLTTSARRP